MKSNEHTHISDLLPLYAAGTMDRDQCRAVEQHLKGCAECQADLALWSEISGAVIATSQPVSAPRGLADRVITRARKQARKTSASWLAWLALLLRVQMPLVQREIWPASALVIGLGFVAAAVANHSGFIYALAPLVTAACVSMIYGPENDAAYELALSTPTSPRQILLARLVLVFGYNLVLALAASFCVLPFLQQPVLLDLVLSWLAPMTFLSAAALALSLWIGTPNAISATYLAWLVNLVVGPLRASQSAGISPVMVAPQLGAVLDAYTRFWQSPLVLLALSAVLFAAALWLAGRQPNKSLYFV